MIVAGLSRRMNRSSPPTSVTAVRRMVSAAVHRSAEMVLNRGLLGPWGPPFPRAELSSRVLVLIETPEAVVLKARSSPV